MPVYEFVLRFSDRPDEVRLGDRPPRRGDVLLIGGRQWTVVARVDGNGRAAARFLLDPRHERLPFEDERLYLSEDANEGALMHVSVDG